MKKFILALALMVGLMVPMAHSQVHVGIGFGVPIAPMGCPYGYFDFYPYTCAPLGYYGSDWFVGGMFIGAGPWYGGHYNRYYHGHGFHGHPVIVTHSHVTTHIVVHNHYSGGHR